jgi:hypothetical protein
MQGQKAKQDFIRELRELGFSARKSTRAVNALFEVAAKALQRGEAVELGAVRIWRTWRPQLKPRFFFRNGTHAKYGVLGPGLRYKKPRPSYILRTRALIAFYEDYVETIPVRRSHRVPCDGG